MSKPLNIIHLHGHDAGRFFQPYGYNTPTPRLQRLAEQGVTFRRAFSAAPTCSPSRSALMTGEYPHVCGQHGLASAAAYFEVNDYQHHLASYLKASGYKTAVAGVNHETRGIDKPLADLGYEWLNHEPNGMPIRKHTIDAALQFINREHDRPFFLSCGFNEPHRDNRNQGRRHSADVDATYVEQLDGRFTRPPEMIPDTPLTRQDWASFCDGVGRLDAKMGVILDGVDRAGLADSTLIIATTDHGIAWPHGKANLTDTGLGVMLIMRGPTGSGFEGGRVIDGLVSHMDLYPTICELGGIETPPWVSGRSLMPLIDGSAESIREHIFGEQSWHGWGYDPQRSVRTDRYKYIRRKPVKHQRIIDPGPTNDWMRELGYKQWPAGTELLYDTWFDPCEMCNLIDDPKHAAIKDDLSQRLDEWMTATRDPFMTDSIPEPTICKD